MKKHLLMRSLLMLLISINASAQTDSQGLALQKAYTVEELSYGKIPKELNPSQISPIDLIEAQVYRLYFRSEEKIFNNGHHVYQMDLLNSSDIFANWPSQIKRMVSDSTGTRFYDSTYALVNFKGANSAYSTDYNEVRLDLLANLNEVLSPEFPMPSSAELTQFGTEGYNIQLLDGDAIKISNDEEEILYEPQNLSISTKIFEQGRLVSEDFIRYQNIIDYGVVPISDRQVTYVVRPSGMCMEKIRVRRYSDYRIELAERSQQDSPKVEKELTPFLIWPNPVNDAFFVQVPSNIMPGSAIRILDASGILIMDRKGAQPNSRLNFNVQQMQPGVYNLEIQSLIGIQIQKFIKM